MNKNNERKINKQSIRNNKNLIKETVLEKRLIKKKIIRNYEKGITLIALVITIIVLLVLSGITIAAVGENGLFFRAKEAKFKSKMAGYRESTNMYVSWKITENTDTNTDKINSGDKLKESIDKGIITDISKEDVATNIEEIITNITKEDKEMIVIYKGEMWYVSNDKIANNDKQVEWCKEIGIKILEYKEPEGIVVKNGRYELVNGVYLCTPKLDEGFKSERTRYLEVNKDGNLIPGNWIDENPTESWYDYKNQKWANILVENNGSEIYYVWIPRYCFKLDQTKERSDVKFIDTDNNYKDEEGNITTWEELEQEGYQVPEAFTCQKDALTTYELSGYWMTKYTLGDIATPSTINYDMTVSKGIVTLKNITLNTTITNANPIVKYTVALNGSIVQTIDKKSEVDSITTKSIQISNLKAGNNTINVTGLNAGGEVVGSMTKEYAPAIVNKPDLSGFDKETTFYVTYDEEEKEYSTIPISQEMPQNWYEYGSSQWAKYSNKK